MTDTTDTKALLAFCDMVIAAHAKAAPISNAGAIIAEALRSRLEAELRMPKANWLKEQIEYAYDAGLSGFPRHEVVAEILQHLSTPVTPTPK
jgi:hypothetical protein